MGFVDMKRAFKFSYLLTRLWEAPSRFHGAIGNLMRFHGISQSLHETFPQPSKPGFMEGKAHLQHQLQNGRKRHAGAVLGFFWLYTILALLAILQNGPVQLVSLLYIQLIKITSFKGLIWLAECLWSSSYSNYLTVWSDLPIFPEES